MSLEGRHILLGITGSIAAYKAAVLCRLLKGAGAEVKVVMTPLAKQFNLRKFSSKYPFALRKK